MSSDVFLNQKHLKRLDIQLQNLISTTGLDRKTLDEVFDTPTLLLLGKLISNKIIETVDFPISTGKEANIFRCVTPEKSFVALKIYRTSTSTFKHLAKYINGDPRFHCVNRSRRDLVYEWAKKEYKNLQRVQNVKIPAPKPMKQINNILVMEYLGDYNQSAPVLKDIVLQNPEEVFDVLIGYLQTLFQKARLIHADFSIYNILWFKKNHILLILDKQLFSNIPSPVSFLNEIYITLFILSKNMVSKQMKKKSLIRLQKNKTVNSYESC